MNQTTLCRPILALPLTDVIISHTLSDFQIIPAPPNNTTTHSHKLTKETRFYDRPPAGENPKNFKGRGGTPCAPRHPPGQRPVPPTRTSSGWRRAPGPASQTLGPPILKVPVQDEPGSFGMEGGRGNPGCRHPGEGMRAAQPRGAPRLCAAPGCTGCSPCPQLRSGVPR